MMESSIFDLAVDILVERGRDARAELVKRFKKTKPFRMEPMSDADRIQQYMQWAGTPVEGKLRSQLGDEQVDMIHANIQELIRRQSNG